MNKKLLIFATAFAFVFSLAISGGVAKADEDKGPADEDKGPAEMVLQTGNAKKPANFSHVKHQENYKCAECHHSKTDDGKKGEYKAGAQAKCVTCHNKDDMPDKLKLNNFKGVGHAQCKGCHKKEQKGPSKCTGCHPKKKKNKKS